MTTRTREPLSRGMTSTECASVFGMHRRTWRRYWVEQPDIRAAAFRTGPRGAWRFPEAAIRKHLEGLR